MGPWPIALRTVVGRCRWEVVGMYTEFCIGVALKQDVHQDVVDTLATMVTGEAPFDDRRKWMLVSEGSAYFDQIPVLRWEKVYERWSLTCWTNIKNYASEIEWLFEFLAPHVDGFEDAPYFMGFMRYEEDDIPTLVFSVRGAVVYGGGK